MCLVISKLLKLIAQFWTCFKPRSFLFRTSVIRIFTPSNVCAMTNLVKAIDLRCFPIMQIHYVFRGRQLNFYFFAYYINSISVKLNKTCYKALQKITDR